MNIIKFNNILLQARNKPADGGGHVNQKNAAGQKATPPCQKGNVIAAKFHYLYKSWVG